MPPKSEGDLTRGNGGTGFVRINVKRNNERIKGNIVIVEWWENVISC